MAPGCDSQGSILIEGGGEDREKGGRGMKGVFLVANEILAYHPNYRPSIQLDRALEEMHYLLS